MKTPKKLKICGLIWEVEENEKTTVEGNNFGSTHYRKQRIFIEPTETEQKKNQISGMEVICE